METISLWTLIPVVTALVVALFMLGRSHSWNDPVFTSAKTNTEENKDELFPNNYKSEIKRFFFTHQWELLLTVTALGLVVYLFFAAPAQLTGKVAIEPNQPGRPFYSLHWIREFLSDNYNRFASFSNVLSGSIALALLLAAILRRSPAKLRFSLLWSLISLAGSAQWMFSSESQFTAGLILNVIAVPGFFLWSGFFGTSVESDLDKTPSISLRWEVVLVFITLALATFGRMYYLKSIPYGIEGDEAKWTAEVVSLGIRGEPDKLGMYHRDALPTSFYVQTLFHKLLGPSIITARFEVAFFSILATLFFYLLLRQITVTPLALLSTWFLSASIFDISASRLAHVESHVKLWPILTLALLAWAMHKKRWQVYTIAGISLAIGLLTYDTVWPILPAAFIIAATEFWQNKDKFVDAFRNLIALIIPSMLALPLLIPYIADRMSYYLPDGRPNDLVSLWGYFTNILFSWYVGTFNDFLYNRPGPLLNSFLLPWMTFGLIVALTTLRRRLSYWTLIWAFLFIIPVPMAANSPFGRVYYPALPAVYVLVAIGIYIVGQESLRALGHNFRPLVSAVTLLVLVWVPLFNLFIYFNEVEDYDDRQIRREAAELAGAAAGPDTLIILAVIPQADEPLNNEHQMIELFMLNKLSGNQIADSYKYMALNDILPSLSTITTRSNISIILDKITVYSRQKRNDLANTLQTCYPQASWVKGFFFDRVDLNSEALSSPACISTTLSMEYTSANTIHWGLGQGTASGLSLKCEDQKTFHEYVEAETMPLSPGWGMETAIAHGWTDEGFIMDNYGSTPISYNFTLTEEKPVYIWARSYKRAADNSPGQITIFNQTFIFGAADEHKLNQWNWERIGPFIIPSGLNAIYLDRPYLDDPNRFMAIFVDAIVLTADPDFTPAKDRELGMRTQTFNFLQEQEEGELTLTLEPGAYRCYAKAFSKQPLVDAFGHTPLTSDTINFTIAP